MSSRGALELGPRGTEQGFAASTREDVPELTLVTVDHSEHRGEVLEAVEAPC